MFDCGARFDFAVGSFAPDRFTPRGVLARLIQRRLRHRQIVLRLLQCGAYFGHLGRSRGQSRFQVGAFAR